MQRSHSRQHKTRKVHSLFVGIILIALVLSGCGKASVKTYRVGILSGLGFFASTADSFKTKMAELGYIEGQNISYDIQQTNVDAAAEEQILKKFVADKVDLIFVFPTEASLAAKQITQGTNIPVIFAQAFTEQGGLIESVREPGENITGVRFPGPDMAIKRFEVLRELVPQAQRVWVPYQQGYPNVPPQLEALRPVAAAAGVTLIEAPFASAADLQADLQTRNRSADISIDAILMIAEPLVLNPDAFTAMGTFAAEHKLLIGGALVEMAGYSTIFGVMIDNTAVGNQAAPLADKALKGIRAGTIPVATAEAYLKINYKAAQALGITVSDGLLRQAVEVIRS